MKSLKTDSFFWNSVFIDSHIKKTDKIDEYFLIDHLHGFDENFSNEFLENLNNKAEYENKNYIINYNQILLDKAKTKYKNLEFKFDLKNHEKLIGQFETYKKINFSNRKIKNFACCFIGSEHISRQFLSAILFKTKMWNDQYCTKNFQFEWETLDGNLSNYLDESSNFLYKLFLDYESNFNKKIIDISYKHCDNVTNLYKIEKLIDESFVNIVSETLGTSFNPNITEKFINSIVTKNLFVTYGQPNWHFFIEKYHGFKLYDKIFDYNFDKINNPVQRLVRLIEMLSKFQNLSPHDWHDLYHEEKDTIDYNYDHYRSKRYLKNLAKFV